MDGTAGLASQDQQSIDLGQYWSALKRRWLLLAAPAVLIMPIALLLAYTLPPIYSATARVLVESPQIPTELAQSTVRVGAAERLALIQQRLTTRENLLAIANKHTVFADRPAMSPTQIVNEMRAAILFTSTRLDRNRGPVTGVNITFQASSPQTAANVANELLTLLLEFNAAQRSERAVQTSAYFRGEVTRLAAELGRIEERIAAFKTENEDALPESLGFRRSALAAIQERAFERELRLIALDEQIQGLEEAIREGSFDAEGQTPEERELGRLRQLLAQQRAVYSDNHPSIRSILSRIGVLEAQIAGAGAGPAPVDATQRAADQLEGLQRQRAELTQRMEADERRGRELEASIERTPGVELALSGLERDRQSIAGQYNQAVAREAEAATGERLEVNQQSERFEVLEQPQVPSSPESPNRPLIVVAGFAGSLGLGFGLVVLAELLNRGIRTPRDLEARLGIRPFVTIPFIRTEEEISRRRTLLRLALVGALVVVPALLYFVDQRVTPLELLISDMLERTGILSLVEMVETRFRQ
jgi:polysaccharide chain length determinant protein (PEP-CTERM system associated)